jgi:hypothetical protein
MSSNDTPNYQVAKSDTAPWAAQQPYLTTGFETAKGLLNSGQPQFYPNATYVPMSGTTGQALGQGEAAANQQWGATNQGNLAGLTPGAIDQTMATMRGDYLTQQNPYFQQMLQNTFQKAQPTIDAAFAGGGRGISGARDAAVSDAWASTAGNLGYQDYAKERQNQLAAIAAAPGMAQAGLDPLKQLSGIGTTREGYAGQELQDTLNRYNAQQNSGWNNLGKYQAAIGGGSFGNQQTQYIPTTSNPWGQAIAGAGTAASLLGSLFGRNGAFPGALS